mmetsp:Transcript_4398/g.11956  ORF Transcript_4398/g.11956 Transcript_4398/m.11956 type:complete len:316 (+) Transcript_4398:459-1406(+)
MQQGPRLHGLLRARAASAEQEVGTLDAPGPAGARGGVPSGARAVAAGVQQGRHGRHGPGGRAEDEDRRRSDRAGEGGRSGARPASRRQQRLGLVHCAAQRPRRFRQVAAARRARRAPQRLSHRAARLGLHIAVGLESHRSDPHSENGHSEGHNVHPGEPALGEGNVVRREERGVLGVLQRQPSESGGGLGSRGPRPLQQRRTAAVSRSAVPWVREVREGRRECREEEPLQAQQQLQVHGLVRRRNPHLVRRPQPNTWQSPHTRQSPHARQGANAEVRGRGLCERADQAHPTLHGVLPAVLGRRRGCHSAFDGRRD